MEKFILRYGQNGDEVKLVQELLNLNDHKVPINGIYDEVTKNIIKKFQVGKNLKEVDGEVIDTDDYLMLIKPLEVAKAKLSRANTIYEMIVLYAYHHLAQNPRDVGGDNCGPWVRLYCRGMERFEYSWDCGFVSYIMKQSFETMDIRSPLVYELSYNRIVNNAKQRNIYFHYDNINRKPIAGNLFLIRNGDYDWKSIGIIVKVTGNKILTIEVDKNKVLGQQLRVIGTGMDLIMIQNILQ